MNASLFTITACIDNQTLQHHATAQQLPGNMCEHTEKKKEISIWQFPALLSLNMRQRLNRARYSNEVYCEMERFRRLQTTVTLDTLFYFFQYN